MQANFGTPRPGSDPPPRRALTPEEIHFRETFNRAAHLAQQSGTIPPVSPQQPPTANTQTQAKVFDENAIRDALRQEGMDFAYQIFPIGEKPQEAGPGVHAHRENRLQELESERVVIRGRMLVAEQAAAGAIRDLNELQGRFDTLQSELETLRVSTSKEKREAT